MRGTLTSKESNSMALAYPSYFVFGASRSLYVARLQFSEGFCSNIFPL